MNELPPFLQQTGPHTFTLTLSASAAETHMLCPAKYAWSRVTGIETASARAGMNYGKGLHIALAYRYAHMAAQAEEEAIRLIEAHFTANPQPALGRKERVEWRTPARAIAHFRAYNARYPAEDFEVLGVEEPFEARLGTFEAGINTPSDANQNALVTVNFRGIRDLRVLWHDSIWVLDHKTSTEWSDLAIDEGRASFQFMGYAWVERFAMRQALAVKPSERGLVSRAGGVIGNYLISRESYSEGYKPRANALPRDQFARQEYPYSDAQLDEWHARAIGIAKAIWRSWREEEWPQNSTACAHWGRCEYYRLCWETDPDYRLAAALGADYQRRAVSPMDAEGEEKERA